ncbi:rhodanese-like domain-containing protein [Saccharopolyspora cebuensis]|uniref:rhodanese-like domain-containing protein n=1 Tax=Saccharopolyspora cebuensis TaxID=418759 RepID=UPI0031E7DAC1
MWKGAFRMVPEIEVAALAAARDRGARIVDVRSAEEYARGHVPGAENVPLEEVLAAPERFAGAAPHVVCQAGGRSATATEAMNAAGARAVSVAGGTAAWVEAGYEVATGDAAGGGAR